VILICFFVTDLHGHVDKYAKLMEAIITDRPRVVFLGGDLLPNCMSYASGTAPINFVSDYLVPAFQDLRAKLGKGYPAIFLILGNDDPKCEEPLLLDAERQGLWSYMHGRKTSLADLRIYGYSCVPPTPFLLKDWERYDVSRYVSPGCVSPEEGRRTVAVPEQENKWRTIKKDLDELVDDDSLERAIFLLHTPPHETPLDRAALDGRMVEHVPLDVHVGSIAVRRLIDERQPLLTLHGHVHESARITGEWKIQIGRTVCINAAHDGPELALVRFSTESPADATRELL
jgi:Icc-related predicted phosphoesterase